VDCGDFGSFEVVTVENAAAAFANGGVLVAKRIAADVSVTVTTFDDQVFGPFPDSFDEGGRGQGYQQRLIECSFAETFEETFTLDERTADFFHIPAQYVGREVTLTGEVEGTAWVIDPKE
jgi:hypothetical protein